ncbi:MAG: FkbM family methyltransferase, partial [Dolichospermum sp.]
NIYDRLGLKNVKVQNLGLSDQTQELSAIVPVYPSGDKNYYRVQIKEVENNENILTLKLKCVSLDEFWDGLNVNNPITFIKIDVEGHELSVIRGSITTLKKFKPALLVEVSGNPDDPISEAFLVFSILLDIGYYAYWFDGTQLRKRCTNDRSINYFFLTENHLSKVYHTLQVQPNK